jgi:hypothetical protein
MGTEESGTISLQKIQRLDNVKVVEVVTREQAKQFLQVHVELNKSDLNWVRPLDRDIKSVFNIKTNKFYRHGEAIRWILLDGDRQLLGRIAAFTNDHYTNKGDDIRVGGIGFFDCIDNQEAANLLFDTARNWLQHRDMAAMDGPINFGERDKWWGLLIKGFAPPLYGMNFNPPYYQRLFETYGFKVFYNQMCFQVKFDRSGEQLATKFYSAHTKFVNNPAYRVKNITKRGLRQYAGDFCQVYNKAWAGHSGNKTLSEEKAYKLFLKMKPIMNDYLGWIAYYRDDPVAVYINVPDLNQIICHLNGKMNWWSKFKFLYYLKRGECQRFVGVVYGVIPEFQGSGIDYFMVVEAEKAIKANTNFKEFEMQWIGEFNPKMLAIARSLNGVESRRLATYRYLFDRDKPYSPHPLLS